MLYMLSCIVVMVTALNKMFETVSKQLSLASGGIQTRGAHVFQLLAVMIMAMAYSAPVMTTFLTGMNAANGQPIPLDDARWTVYAVLLGSLMTAAYGGFAWKARPSESRSGFWAVGRSLVLAIVVVTGLASSISHLMFFAAPRMVSPTLDF